MADAGAPKGPTTIRRDELYNQVWSTPMHRLAAEYGISGNGLAKICDRLKIPYPPRGYWAKKEAGKKVVQYRLPERDENTPQQVTIRPTAPAPKTDLPPELEAKVERIKAEAAEVVVSDNLSRPHSVIAKWLADHKERKARARRERNDPFTVKVEDFTPLDDRRHRVLDALFKALEKQGARIKEEGRAGLSAEIQGEKIEFQLRSKLKQIKRPLNEREKRWKLPGDKDWKQELEPTGRLVFSITTYAPVTTRKEWLESEQKPIETSLPDIVSAFFIIAPALAAWHRKLADDAEQRRIAEQKRQEEAQRRRKDDNRWRRFVELAYKWRDFEIASEFLEKLKDGQWDQAATLDGRTIAEWIEWAESHVKTGNPLSRGADAVFTSVVTVHEWTYRD